MSRRGGLSLPCAADTNSSAVSPFSGKSLHQTIKRDQYEPNEFEVEDKIFFDRIKRRRVASMPWCARTKAQWEHDLAHTQRELLTSDRGKAFLATKPVSHELALPSDGGSDSDDDVSDDSSSSTSSSASSRRAVGAGKSSRDAASQSVKPGNGEGCHWVLPKNGKLHLRVDMSDSCCLMCKPQRSLARGYKIGDNAAEAAETKRAWCKTCLEMF